MNDIATKRFELMNHKLLLELERLEENQIKGRCETCEWATHDNTRCEDPIIEFKIDTEPMGYCHRWEKRI